jgi:hypothetical protein
VIKLGRIKTNKVVVKDFKEIDKIFGMINELKLNEVKVEKSSQDLALCAIMNCDIARSLSCNDYRKTTSYQRTYRGLTKLYLREFLGH